MSIDQYIKPEILEKFEYFSYGHALEILHESFPTEWNELQDCLLKLKLTKEDITQAGGNESPIPKKFDEVLYPYGWREIRISGDLIVKKYPRQNAQRRGAFTTLCTTPSELAHRVSEHSYAYFRLSIPFATAQVVPCLGVTSLRSMPLPIQRT